MNKTEIKIEALKEYKENHFNTLDTLRKQLIDESIDELTNELYSY